MAAPIIYVFNTTGQGEDLMGVFKKSAERMGWVIIGCNGFKGQRSDRDVFLADRLFGHVRVTIPHDTSRACIAGLGKSAARGYRFSRRFWNEFSGVITLGGHMASYDRRYIFPEATSFVVINSKADKHANIWQDKDLMILRASGSARKYITYDSRRKRPPEENIANAMQWLDGRWKEQRAEAGAATQEETGQKLLKQAETALKTQNYAKTLHLAIEIAVHNPLSESAPQANELIEDIMLNPSYMRKATLAHIPDDDKNLKEILLYRARDREGFSCGHRLSRYELALAAGGKNAELSAETAYVLASCADGKAQALNRAESLASYATETNSDGWYGWHVRALLASIRGYTPRAIEYEKRAVSLAPDDMKRACLKALGEYQKK